MNLFDLIEEVISENSSLGFGEGTPPKGKLGKKQVVSLEEETEEEHDFGGLRAQAKSTDEEGVSTSFRPMKEDFFLDKVVPERDRIWAIRLDRGDGLVIILGRQSEMNKKLDSIMGPVLPEDTRFYSYGADNAEEMHKKFPNAVTYEEFMQSSKEDTEELEEMSAMGAGAVEGGGISREEFVEELKLREFIQKGIKRVKDKKNKEILEEEKLRSFIRSMIKEGSTPDVSPTPNRATGINVLEELLKKIIPVLETDYKTLTTNPEQRQSFRAHILNAAENTLRPAMVNDSASDTEVLDEPGLNQLQELDNSIDIDIEDDDDFISIESEKEKEKDPVQEFGLEGENETGRNMAYQSFKKIEANILDSYSLLSDVEDQELFYTYLLTNLKLYFDKFEEELNPAAVEPTTDAYEQAVEA